MFQSTHPFGCDVLFGRVTADTRSFNPRTRLGATHRHVIIIRRLFGFNPRTRLGATCVPSSLVFAVLVSIHAPVWVRRAFLFVGLPFFSFNPCTRLGATLNCVDVEDGTTVFQSTHPFGCDFLPLSTALLPLRFQSTHPFGCDLLENVNHNVPMSFNPRTRLGATRLPFQRQNEQTFQSTHPFGCDSENFIFSLLSFTSMYLSSHYRVLFGSD